MALIRPAGPSWAYCSHNLPSTPDATAFGTSCTPGTSNADGTAVTMLSALTHDVEYLKLLINATCTATTNNDVLVNVLIDPSGGTSWSTLIPWLIAGGMGDVGQTGLTPAGPSGHYDFPIWIPAGASLGLQARSAASASPPVLKVAAFAYGGNANPSSWWCGQRVKDIGISSSTSTGQAHTAGASGSYSSWTDLGSTLDDACGALQFAVNGEGDNAWSTAAVYQFEIGVGGDRIGAPLYRIHTSSEAGWQSPTGPIFRKLASGTQLQIRGKCNGAGGGSAPQPVGVAAWTVH